jgi:hypothetical protein
MHLAPHTQGKEEKEKGKGNGAFSSLCVEHFCRKYIGEHTEN